jgi:hypothetical protein
MEVRASGITRRTEAAVCGRDIRESVALRELTFAGHQRARLLESLFYDIRKYSDLISPEVSVRAKLEADRIGVDLSIQGWQDQPRFDPGRVAFAFEHMAMISSIRERCMSAQSEADVADVLRADATVVWILRAEDEKLNSLGFRSNRADPEGAYVSAGIELYRGGI